MAVVIILAQHKITSFAKCDRANGRLGTIQCLVVRVPAHVVSAMAILIEQA